MSATLAGAVKARLEAAGLGVTVHRDLPPPEQPLPYLLVREGIATAPEPSGDFGDPNGEHEVREQAQVDVVQAWKGPEGDRLERYGLPQAVGRVLHGANLEPVLGGRCWPARVLSSTRFGPEPGDPAASRGTLSSTANLVRDVLTVEVLRTITPTTA